MGHGSKFFTIEVLNEVEDFDGDAIEDAHDPDDDNDGYSDIAEIAYGSGSRIELGSRHPAHGYYFEPSGNLGKPAHWYHRRTVHRGRPRPKGYSCCCFNDLNANDSHNHLFTD